VGYCAVSLEKSDDFSIEVKPYNSQKVESVWRWSKKKAMENITIGNLDLSQIAAKQKSDGNWNIYEKSRRTTTKAKSLWAESSMRTEDGTRALRGLFDKNYFDHPKPIELIKRCVQIGLNEEDIALDFFSGSGTTAQAVLELNEEDGGNRQFICLQLPELLEEESEAYKAGYRTIADIGRARIQKVIERMEAKRLDEGKQASLTDEEENPKQTLGFNAFKLVPSNFKEWRTDIDSEADLLAQMEYHIDSTKPDSEPFSMVYELLLKLALPLTTPITCHDMDRAQGTQVYVAAPEGGKPVAMFFDPVSEEITAFMLKEKPSKVLCLNKVFVDSQSLTNFSLQLRDAGIELEVL
jgi:adenine-specific DNA-methyltransferase